MHAWTTRDVPVYVYVYRVPYWIRIWIVECGTAGAARHYVLPEYYVPGCGAILVVTYCIIKRWLRCLRVLYTSWMGQQCLLT